MKVDVDLDEATLRKAMQVAKSEDPKHVLELALRAFVRAATQSAPQKITLTKRRRSRVKLAKKPQTAKEKSSKCRNRTFRVLTTDSNMQAG